jgi:clan AA aspartic protease
MMKGIVTEDLEPQLRLAVLDVGGRSTDVETIIDTGFNGFLTLPPALIEQLGLRWLCRQDGELADGTVQAFDVYVATVGWDGQLLEVEVDAADAQPLIGMALMRGLELRIEVVPGGAAVLTAIP